MQRTLLRAVAIAHLAAGKLLYGITVRRANANTDQEYNTAGRDGTNVWPSPGWSEDPTSVGSFAAELGAKFFQ
jgi:hypothetical protein